MSIMIYKSIMESKIKENSNLYWKDCFTLDKVAFKKSVWEYKKPGNPYYSIISWHEALDIITDDLDTIDPETGYDSAIGIAEMYDIALSINGIELLNGGFLRARLK